MLDPGDRGDRGEVILSLKISVELAVESLYFLHFYRLFWLELICFQVFALFKRFKKLLLEMRSHAEPCVYHTTVYYRGILFITSSSPKNAKGPFTARFSIDLD